MMVSKALIKKSLKQLENIFISEQELPKHVLKSLYNVYFYLQSKPMPFEINCFHDIAMIRDCGSGLFDVTRIHCGETNCYKQCPIGVITRCIDAFYDMRLFVK